MRIRYLTVSFGLAFALLASAPPAEAEGPPKGYELQAEHTVTSPDGATTVEQHVNKSTDDWKWQFWARRKDGFTQLEPGEAGYPAGFGFTKDSRWLTRIQKTGAGYSDVYLYRLTPKGFVSAAKKPLSDLAWAYFHSRLETKKVPKPDLHISAGVVDGVEDNYRALGVNWSDSRYLVIWLAGGLDPTPRHRQLDVVRGWQCRYDLVKGTFDVPPAFARENAKALAAKDQ
jgi:hypothetical protein